MFAKRECEATAFNAFEEHRWYPIAEGIATSQQNEHENAERPNIGGSASIGDTRARTQIEDFRRHIYRTNDQLSHRVVATEWIRCQIEIQYTIESNSRSGNI